MAQFSKENLHIDGSFGGSEVWVTYHTPGTGSKFVARCKYFRPRTAAKNFVKFLIANFTVEEYFTALEVERKAPLEILKSKGYEPTVWKPRKRTIRMRTVGLNLKYSLTA